MKELESRTCNAESDTEARQGEGRWVAESGQGLDTELFWKSILK